MPSTKAQIAWNEAHTTRVVMRLNYKTDADILSKLESVGNKQGYVKELIRNDLKNSGKENEA